MSTIRKTSTTTTLQDPWLAILCALLELEVWHRPERSAREAARGARPGRVAENQRGVFCGEIIYTKVRAMTRVATAENEEFPLMIARHGTASHMERAVRQYRQGKRCRALAAG